MSTRRVLLATLEQDARARGGAAIRQRRRGGGRRESSRRGRGRRGGAEPCTSSGVAADAPELPGGTPVAAARAHRTRRSSRCGRRARPGVRPRGGPARVAAGGAVSRAAATLAAATLAATSRATRGVSCRRMLRGTRAERRPRLADRDGPGRRRRAPRGVTGRTRGRPRAWWTTPSRPCSSGSVADLAIELARTDRGAGERCAGTTSTPAPAASRRTCSTGTPCCAFRNREAGTRSSATCSRSATPPGGGRGDGLAARLRPRGGASWRAARLTARSLGSRRGVLTVIYEDEERRTVRALLRGVAQGAITGRPPACHHADPGLPGRGLERLARADSPAALADELVRVGHPAGRALRDAILTAPALGLLGSRPP